MFKISNAELDVLKIIWKNEITNSIEINNELEQHEWSINTTRTLIKRLLNKGIIKIVDKKGKVYYYKSTIKKEDYQYYRINELLEKLFNNDIQKLIEIYIKRNNNC